MALALALADAIIAIARLDLSSEWARYEILCARHGYAPRELLRATRIGSYNSLQLGTGGPEPREVCEAVALTKIFLTAFVAAVHAGRCSVRAVPEGKLADIDIDPARITVEAFKRLSKDGQRWTFAGATYHYVTVVMAPAPEPEDASTEQVRAGGTGEAQGVASVEAVGTSSSAPVKQYNPMLPPRPTRSGKQQNIWDAVAKRHPEGPLPPTALLLQPLNEDLDFEVKRDAINRTLKRRKG